MVNGWMQDDDLPNWGHTVLLIIIVSPFALLLIFPGVRAVATGILPPMAGPELGQWMFGQQELRDDQAVLAGWVLISFGLTFLSLAAAFSRWAQDILVLRALPWVLAVFDIAFYSSVLHAIKP